VLTFTEGPASRLKAHFIYPTQGALLEGCCASLWMMIQGRRLMKSVWPTSPFDGTE
jgi:hypothetical protein